MRIAIATVQAPFIRGGAESLAAGLLDACRRAGHEADIVTLPFRFFPESAVLHSMDQWEAEDFSSFSGIAPDRVICLKFPAYYLHHPAKTVWLLHQHRPVYDLWPGESASIEARALRQEILRRDVAHLSSARLLFADSKNVARRLKESTGLAAPVVYHPPPRAGELYCAPAEPYIFAPSRLEELKRQSLLIEAMRYVRAPVVALIAGEGGQRGVYEASIEALGLGNRVRLLGAVSQAEMTAFYAHSLGVFFGPLDEDYGYVTLEAMLARKPVITCTDSGGPLEFVRPDETGYVVPADSREIAAAIDRLYDDSSRAAEMGENGWRLYQSLQISWESAVAVLTQ